ncbi:MAG: ABC transporter permease [Caldilineaceae bacterium]|nr:ABC transporter permease [Caldilineaceae bacterium]MCB9139228.1 ABC transporter permease [Caldilineaceae bacterium]
MAVANDLSLASEQPESRHENQTRRVLRRLMRSTNARVGIFLVVAFLLIALLVPLVDDYDARRDLDLSSRLQPPSSEHWFGTDDLGRDVLRRVLHGARVSLQVAILSVSISLIIGSMIGLVAGMTGGWVDNVLMRLMDIMLAFPYVLLAIALVTTLGAGLRNTMIAIGIVYVPIYARLSRSVAISLREEDYVMAARSIGSTQLRILFSHIVPNGLSPIIVQATLSMGIAVLDAAALGFLGLGQQPPYPEWGKMLVDSLQFILSGSWWVMLFPGLAIMLTVLGFNLLGDGLRDALDPRLRM